MTHAIDFDEPPAETAPAPETTTSKSKSKAAKTAAAAAAPAGTTEAKTAPGSKQRRTQDERILAQYDRENGRLGKLQTQFDKADAVVARLRPELDSLKGSVDLLRRHPAVVRRDGEPPAVEAEAAEPTVEGDGVDQSAG